MGSNTTANKDAAQLSRLAEALVAAATKAGADEADAMAVGGQSTSIDVRAGALEHADRAEAIEIGCAS